MTKANSIKLSILGVAITVLIVLFLVFRKDDFTDTKDNIYNLLHLNKLILVRGDSESIKSNHLLKKYYDIFGYNQIWSDKAIENARFRTMLIQMLNHADSFGLDRRDYHNDYVVKYDSLSRLPFFETKEFESENELIYTDAALSFLLDVAYGKEIVVSYSGVKYQIDSARVLNALEQLLKDKDWETALKNIEPTGIHYQSLKKELNRMQQFVASSKDADSLPVSITGDNKKTITLKLKAYNLLPDTAEDVADTVLSNGIKAFQQEVNLKPTGKPDAQTIAALNIPLTKRIEQLKQSLNYWRWTARIKEPRFILVNIPAARLQLVTPDTPQNTISMKVIVGKPTTQTPAFTAYIYRIIAYPYWTVPLSIATDEMLPKILKKPSYLEENSLHVLNNRKEELDPGTIKWKKYSKDNFPFTIRQSTGCDNSLGVLKFDINSPYAIYMHDTNLRGLFEKESRFLSHGCMRVEKPAELAHYILGEEFDTDTEQRLNDCLKGELPSEIRLKKKLPVLIFYMTADMDENGSLKFYPDVYEIEKKGFSEENVASPAEVGLPD